MKGATGTGSGREHEVAGGALASAFLRGFAVQGCWNYRTMLGGGIAFGLLPVLRTVYRNDREALERALARHAEHFNAHPYLAGLATGAIARLELDGADPEVQRHFKRALWGPLGGLGDTLVWASWLPATLLLALVVHRLGAPGAVAAGLFLLVYNTGHVALRFWGFRVGVREGKGVGGRLQRAGLAHRAAQLTAVGAVLLGALYGLLVVSGLRAVGGGLGTGAVWVVVAAAAFGAGYVGGQRAWRPAALVVVGTVGAVILTRIVL